MLCRVIVSRVEVEEAVRVNGTVSLLDIFVNFFACRVRLRRSRSRFRFRSRFRSRYRGHLQTFAIICNHLLASVIKRWKLRFFRPALLMLHPTSHLQVGSAVCRCVNDDQTNGRQFTQPFFNLRFLQFPVGFQRKAGVFDKLRVPVERAEVINLDDQTIEQDFSPRRKRVQIFTCANRFLDYPVRHCSSVLFAFTKVNVVGNDFISGAVRAVFGFIFPHLKPAGNDAHGTLAEIL